MNPLSYARGLARAAIGAGARVHGGTRVSRLASEGRSWKLDTGRGSVVADQVLLATNGYTDDLWPGLRRTIVPLFGAIAATAELPDEIARTIMPGRSVLYESGAITVYYRVDARRRLLIGGRGPLREINAAAAIPHLLAYARRLWPMLAERRLDACVGWAPRDDPRPLSARARAGARECSRAWDIMVAESRWQPQWVHSLRAGCSSLRLR